MNIDKNTFRSILTKTFSANGLGSYLSAATVDRFIALTELLLTENEKYNLTAITEPEKIILHHYADCATLAELVPKNIKLADVGCGAGFPTLPLAILRPDLKITGIDSTAKRTGYVAMAAEALGLDNVSVITGRAEELCMDGEYRESFDAVTARAVAALPVLCELCIPLVRVGGQFIAMKGKNAEGEVKDSRRAIPMLGGKLLKVREVTLRSQTEELTHPVILISKVQKTPKDLPRAYARITKKPL